MAVIATSQPLSHDRELEKVAIDRSRLEASMRRNRLIDESVLLVIGGVWICGIAHIIRSMLRVSREIRDEGRMP